MRRIVALESLMLLLAACVVHRLQVAPVATNVETPIAVTSPVKAHLVDGSTIVFPDGVSVEKGFVRGAGRRYGLTLQYAASVSDVPINQIAAIESYQTPVSTGASTGASIGSGIGWIVGGTALAVALFGSCPTVYSMDAAGPALEAELFSYSIASSFESRDVDRLGAVAAPGGRLVLEVRNEMLETHYIDQLGVLEILHATDQTAYPDEKGEPLVVGRTIAPSSAVDQSGRDVAEAIRAADSLAWRTPDQRLANVGDDLLDHLDIEFDLPPLPADRKEVALILRMRNSLLSTVLLYDVMLKGQSFGALDWMGADLNRLHNRIQLGLWYREHMGMNVSVWHDGSYRLVKHLGDLGPIAWSARAVALPADHDNKLKLRLSFVADNWRIDQVALALEVTPGQARAIPIERATTPEGDRADIPAFLAKTDKRYLITEPRDSVRLGFGVGEAPAGKARTFFLASEGYYQEWMRADWLSEERRPRFEPNDAALTAALTLYSQERDELREQFEATRIPIR